MRARGVTCLSVDEEPRNTSKAPSTEFTTVVAAAHERNSNWKVKYVKVSWKTSASS